MVYFGEWRAALVALAGMVCFVLGAAHSSRVVLWAKRHCFRGGFGFSMWLEAVYLLLFGVTGAVAPDWRSGSLPKLAMFLLCFIMGMHNTIMSALSGGAIRSTRMTGTVPI